MKKPILPVFIIAALVSIQSISTVFAQSGELKPRVSVFPVINASDDPGFDAVCGAVHDTLVLTISLLDQYEVVTAEDEVEIMQTSAGRMLAKARELRLDNAIVGKVSRGKSGDVRFDFSVYDVHSGGATLSRSATAASIFAVFETADKLVVDLVGALSGVHIGFGSLLLEPDGINLGYEVFIDGKPAGVNIVSVDQVLNGRRIVEIRQRRLTGYETLTRKTLDIREDEEYTISFAIPRLTDVERRWIDDIKDRILTKIDQPRDSQDIDRLFEEYYRKIDGIERPERLADETAWFDTQTARLAVNRYRWRIEQSIDDPTFPTSDEIATISADSTALSEARILSINMVRLQGARKILANDHSGIPDLYRRSLPATFDDPRFTEEIEYLADLLDARKIQMESRKPPLLAASSIAAGLVLSATSGLLLLTDPAPDMISDADAMYDQYLSETDPDTLEDLHRSIERLYAQANLTEYTKWGSLVAGPILAGLGTSGVISRAKNDLLNDGYLDLFTARCRCAKALSERNQEDTYLLVLTDGDGIPIEVDGNVRGLSPLLVEAKPGNSYSIGASELSSIRNIDITARGGVNIVVLPAKPWIAGEEPRHITEIESGGRHQQFEWPPSTYASKYVVCIKGPDGQYKNVVVTSNTSYRLDHPYAEESRISVAAADAGGAFSRFGDEYTDSTVMAPVSEQSPTKTLSPQLPPEKPRQDVFRRHLIEIGSGFHFGSITYTGMEHNPYHSWGAVGITLGWNYLLTPVFSVGLYIDPYASLWDVDGHRSLGFFIGHSALMGAQVALGDQLGGFAVSASAGILGLSGSPGAIFAPRGGIHFKRFYFKYSYFFSPAVKPVINHCYMLGYSFPVGRKK